MSDGFLQQRRGRSHPARFTPAPADPSLQPTPLRRMPALAQRLGIGELLVKDESERLGLNAFKGVGVAYALEELRLPSGATIVCASAGNHGRAVAHLGSRRGYNVRVFMSASTAPTVKTRIELEGAEVVLVDGTYEDAVTAARAAADAGATLISDVAAEEDERIPALIMAGYGRIFDEARAQWTAAGLSTPDVIIVQAGVGALAGGAAEWAWRTFGDERPFFVCSEPLFAAPLLASARAGQAVEVPVGGGTVMAGLNCTAASAIAVPILNDIAEAFVAIEDERTFEAMRLLALGDESSPITAGPSGAAGMAALLAIRHDPALAEISAAIGERASVLIVNTEGATNEALYDSVVGPTERRFADMKRRLSEMPDRLRKIVAQAPPDAVRRRAAANDFSILENVCHLRDIEREGYCARVRRMLSEETPSLPNIDGDALAIERRYNEDDLDAALAAFESARRDTVAQLNDVTPALLSRRGDLEEFGSLSLHDLLRVACEHDSEHLAALTRLVAHFGATALRSTAGT